MDITIKGANQTSQVQQENSGNRLPTVNIEDAIRTDLVQQENSGEPPATIAIQRKEVNFLMAFTFCVC